MKRFLIAAAGVIAATGGLSAVNVTPAEAQAQARGAPRGSYAQSCTGSYVNQGRLYADCRDTRNRMRETSIELARCSSSDIANDNGLLVCQGHRGDFEDGGRPGGGNGNNPGWPGGPGGGNGGPGWGDTTITVYQDANFRGRSMTFREAIPNLRNSGLNDAISSMRLGRGSWEVCEDANYRGRCQVISNDVRDLARTGMNDRISSLRPARRGGNW
ncbi:MULTISPECIES: beta/gamma crystallin-related protein [unclassified Brevundimonas]|uniref:beta/gamma crystallin-related protein n=1 Tax=unclassified Brevundimonas TaxID=2622653 RepID=UPI0025C08158|nr:MULTISPECIES: beta/gamma crystallin-related protein [unclassified Brevundimonas]